MTIRLGLLLLAAPIVAFGQTITTIAGGGHDDNVPAVEATLGPFTPSVAFDAQGNLLVVSGNRVRRVDKVTGLLTTVAGHPGTGNGVNSTGDGGPALEAGLGNPGKLVVDAGGDIFVTDNGTVRRVSAATGTISLAAAMAGSPAFDGAGRLHVISGDTVDRIDLQSGARVRVAGGGSSTGGTQALGIWLVAPTTIAFDAQGFLYVGELYGVNRIDLVNGTVARYAGTGGTVGPVGDGGPAVNAIVAGVTGLAFDAAGNLYIAESPFARIRRVDKATGIISTVAGSGTGLDGGPALTAAVAPSGLAIDDQGRLYIPEGSNNRVRRMTVGGIIETYAGYTGPRRLEDGQPATAVDLGPVGGFAVAASGDLLVSDDKRVRRIARASNVISTVAGNGTDLYPGDGLPATAAGMLPTSLAGDTAGNVYLGDQTARVRKVDAISGTLSNFAGNGLSAWPADGRAATTVGMQPDSLVSDGLGHVFVADRLNSAVRRVDVATGIATTVASGFVPGDLAMGPGNALYVARDAVDGGIDRIDATTGVATRLWPVLGPVRGLALLPAGAIAYTYFFPEVRIRTAAGVDVAIAGTGDFRGAPGDGGPSTKAAIAFGSRIAFDRGDLFIYDRGGSRIRKVSLAGVVAAPNALDLSASLINVRSAPMRITLLNLGTTTFTIQGLATTGAFGATDDCAGTLAPGGTCSVEVTHLASAVASYSGSLTIQAGADSRTIPLTAAGEHSLVGYYYGTLLRRATDAGGVTYWEGERLRLQSLGASINEVWFSMSSAFLGSVEYRGFNRTTGEYLVDLYRAFFARSPDPEGLAYWTGLIDAGMPREVVLAEFQLSREFRDFTRLHFGDVAARAEVDMVMDFYRGLLGRLPDDAGYRFWVGQLRAAQCEAVPETAVRATAESISEVFATSLETQLRFLGAGAEVGGYFNAFLRRGGDLTGVQYWVNARATNAMTGKQVRDAFRASGEFAARVAAVAAQGCL